MSRDLADENYYVSHGGMIPVKWTAPEVVEAILCIVYKSLIDRLFTSRSTPLLVMCGAMELSCMRYGVWDTNHLRTSPMSK